jgi:hypothetical protein
MKFLFRSLPALMLVAGGIAACTDAPTTSRFTPRPANVSFARIKATDSMMVVTDVTYSDTSLVLKRLTPLASTLSASATIGPNGGSITIKEAGGKIDIPPGALSQPTLITMTAFAGPNVAYEFQPHGLTFAQPVKIQQTIKGTWAELYPTLLKGMHGSYYGQTSLDSAWVDPGKYFAKIDENQIGYFEANASQIKFYVNHFSGYAVSCGFSGGGKPDDR